MNINRICLSCMKDKGIEAICPYCDYDSNTPPLSQQLLIPGETLKGKYLIGKGVKQEIFGVLYVGLDISLNRKVNIYEYLPQAFVSRSFGESEVSAFSQVQEKQFFDGRKKFSSIGIKLASSGETADDVDILDIVETNNTAYVITEFDEYVDLSDHFRISAIIAPIPKPKKKTLESEEIVAPSPFKNSEKEKSNSIQKDNSQLSSKSEPESEIYSSTDDKKKKKHGVARFIRAMLIIVACHIYINCRFNYKQQYF